VKEERNCWAGQEFLLKGMAHVPGGKGAGQGSAERDDERALMSLCLFLSSLSSIIYYLISYLV
jgi:hypothetical protein